ncbi:MAG: HlyD family efflux transporter periplasmic adaptor subunit [Pseudomonadota bacterium]
MRVLARAFTAVFLLCVTLGLLGLAAITLSEARQEQAAREGRQRPASEREYAVNVRTLDAQTIAPKITAFGEVESARTLELRAAVPGRVVALAENFRDGSQVSAGSLLFQTDPADALSAQALAQSDLAEARAELAEATQALGLAEEDLRAAENQETLRRQALQRQRDLLDRGAGTVAAVETAEISLAGAEQTSVGRAQALANAQSRIERAEITLARRQISLAEADRTVEDTKVFAPFDGVLSEVAVVAGGLVNTNEKLADVIDPNALEVAFRLSNAQFAQLIDENGRLRQVPVRAALSLDDLTVQVTGVVVRASAAVEAGQTGRRVFAGLTGGAVAALRPGDFLSVVIEEPPLENVAEIPATAVTNDGRVLVLAAEDRLEEVQGEILRRQGDMVLMSGLPFGREIVTARLPQLGPGVKVRAVREGAMPEAPQTVTLDAERRARLVAAVEGNARMPAEAKERVLARLSEDEVPLAMVERLESRMRPAAQASSPTSASPAQAAAAPDTIALDDGRKARLIAFVEGNTRMPDEAKTRILAQLNTGTAPKDLVERLESRMGG